MKSPACLLVVLSLLPLGAQTSGRIVGAGYRLPAPLEVSPGQVITFFVRREVTDAFTALTANGSPLPLRLNDYSVSLLQSDWPGPVAVPLQAVFPLENCYGGTPQVCAPLSAITVQIPWELIPNFGRRPETFAALTVTHGGFPSEPVPLSPQTDRIHVLTTCDSTLPPGQGDFPYEPGPCRSLVTHLDGSLVTPAEPAVPGETVVALVFGLGRADDRVPTGELPQGVVSVSGVTLGFRAGADVEASRPQSPQEAVGVELSRERVGLYRVSFVVPPLPEGTPTCTATTIDSNMTVTIARSASFDGARICVQP